MPDITEYVQQEIETLSDFIYKDCIDESEYEEKMRYAVQKTIEGIVAIITIAHESELSKVKEEYAAKLLEEQQKLIVQFSGILDKAVSALTYKGPLG
jgi:hypothetical protein